MNTPSRTNSDLPGKILLVDDELTLRLLVERMMTSIGYLVETAEDGSVAVDKLQTGEFDLIISDMNMPNMNGMELLQYSRANFPHIDFLVITGLAKDYTYVEMINAGAVDFIVKPFPTDELTAKVKRIFRERHLIKQYADQAFRLEDMVQERTQSLEVTNTKLQKEITHRIGIEKNLREAKDKIAEEKEKLKGANIEIINLLRRSYQDKGVRYNNPKLLKCWIATKCSKRKCPSYKSDNLRCWQEVGTFCEQQPADSIVDKMRNCEQCKVYKHATTDPISSIGEQFNILVTILERRAKDLKKEQTRAEQASRAKSEFLANMSHEIRTPLNGIVGMVELATSSCIDDKQKHYLNTINSEVNALLIIINDILDFSKIEVGKLELEEIPFDLESLLADIAGCNSLVAEHKGLKYSSYIKPNTPTKLVGDPSRLRQILVNLTNNALKFTSEGEIKVQAEMHTDLGEEIQINFQVKDTGIGIAEENLQSVFESFTQADGSTTRKYGGTGLGTSICKQLTEIMGGDIGVSSDLGKGSTFWFNILIKKQTQEQLDSSNSNWSNYDLYLQSEISEINQSQDTPHHVLLVEDYPTNQQITSMHLQNAGYQVDLAENGRQAVELYKTNSYHLILMDIQMPELDGYQATSLIRKYENSSSKHRTPIIATTAHTTSKYKDKCLSADMDDFLSKPLRHEDLLKMMVKWLHQDTIQAKSSIENPSTAAQIANQPLNSPPINLDIALDEFMGDEALLLEVADTFVESAQERISYINNAIENKNCEIIRREAHTLKGGAANIYAQPFTRLALMLEKSAKDEDLAACATLQTLLRKELQRFTNFMEIDNLNKAHDI